MQSLNTFTTERLIATRFQLDDFETLCHLHRNPEVMATLGGVRTDAETERFLQEKLAHWDRHGFGYWIFREQSTGNFAGRGGLQHIEVGGNPEVEVGYTVRTDFWGQGLATEMAKAMVTLGFEELGLQDIVCFTLTTNQASQRVMEKVGFHFERQIMHEGAPHVLYRQLYGQFSASNRTSLAR